VSELPPENLDDSTNLLAGSWVTLTQHLADVRAAMDSLHVRLRERIAAVPWQALLSAALWHDVGKAHPAFQNMLRRRVQPPPEDVELYAKSAQRVPGRPRYFAAMEDRDERPGFRHELASALAWLLHNPTVDDTSLTAFLIAAHHGKVRGSLRSLPGEKPPADASRRFARGIIDGDVLPALQLDSQTRLPPTVLDLSLMELGSSEHFGVSWLARVTTLRDAPAVGPFRLSFYETLLRIADWHASSAEGAPNVR
jgi:CRISPR-associated endonuclease/helicase Cas3